MKATVVLCAFVYLLFLNACSGGDSGGLAEFADNDAPIEPVDLLRPLFGRLDFRYRFNDSNEADFLDTVVFSLDNVQVVEGGSMMIAGTNQAGNVTVCQHFSVDNFAFDYFCAIVEGVGTAFNVFLVEQVSSSLLVGNFEFCERDCLGTSAGSELILTPDGSVEIIVSNVAESALVDSGNLDIEESRDFHAIDFKRYDEQFSPSLKNQNGLSFLQSDTLVETVNAFNALRNSMIMQ